MSNYSIDVQDQLIAKLADEDRRVLAKKDASYGGSWRKRGGCGAFMMLARKWDRLETMAQMAKYDIFELIKEEYEDETLPLDSDDTIIAQLRDLRRYLFLVDAYMQYKHGLPILARAQGLPSVLTTPTNSQGLAPQKSSLPDDHPVPDQDPYEAHLYKPESSNIYGRPGHTFSGHAGSDDQANTE